MPGACPCRTSPCSASSRPRRTGACANTPASRNPCGADSLKAIPCDHAWTATATATATEKTGGLNGLGYEKNRFVTDIAASTCQKCGAWRGAYGLEPTIEMYIAHTVEILRELRRVLRPDGVMFWNVG